MTDQKPKILAVDDDAINHEILKELLQDDFELSCVDNGQECLDALENVQPDVILMDVNMPVMNGLDACRAIRDSIDHSDISIIFISELSTDEERLAGYEAGANDYITKPFHQDELLAKIQVALHDTEAKRSLKSASDNAMQMAMTAMSQAAEIGGVLRFIQSSFTCRSYDELASLVFDTLETSNLVGSLLFKVPQGTRFITNDGQHRPLEQAVLEKSGGLRIFEFGKRAIFNGERAALLIRQMPDDDEKVGRLKDDLAVLIDSVDARTSGIINEMAMQSRQQQMANIIQATEARLGNISEMFRMLKVDHAQILSNMGIEIEESFIHLGLTQEQEDSMMRIVKITESRTDTLYNVGTEMEKQFSEILQTLQGVQHDQ